MAAWWDTLTALEHALLYVAVPATLVLLIQTILLFLGGMLGGDADADAGADGEVLDAGADGLDLDGDGIPDLDLDGDGIPDLDLDGDGIPDADLDGNGIPDTLDEAGQSAAAGLHVFTLRGIVAFLTLFGWGSLWLCQVGLHPLLALFLGIQMGVLGMVGIALLVREAVKLQYDGTLDIRNAVGLRGTVYLTVPAGRNGTGKVNVLVQEQLREFEALTDSAGPIPTGAGILVTGLAGPDTLVVKETDARA